MSSRSKHRSGGFAVLTALLAFLSLLGLHTAPAASAAGAGARAGEINIIASHSGLCLEMDNSSLTPGAAVLQADCTGQAGAVWRLEQSPAGGNSVQVVNANSGRCIQMTGSALGALAQQADCSNAPTGSFRFVDRGTHVWIQPISATPAKCLEVAAGAIATRTVVRLAECYGQAGTGFHQRLPRPGNDAPDEPDTALERVSVGPGGGQFAAGIGAGFRKVATSANGRHVVFDSSNALVSHDANSHDDVFLKDRSTGALELISVSTAGSAGDGPSERATVSGDGRFVVFESTATNLVNGDVNNAIDVFVRDRQAGTTELVSRSGTGQLGDGTSKWSSISQNGRFVAYSSSATNLVNGDTNNATDVFVRDRQTGTTERVSLSTAGGQGEYESLMPELTPDGRYVVFSSTSSKLVPGLPGASPMIDVFLRDRQAGTTELISVSNSGGEGNSSSYSVSVSADGRTVAFASYASNLLPAGVDTNGKSDVFVRDRQTQTTERISVSHDGAQPAQESSYTAMTGDGRYVIFKSGADRLVPYDTNAVDDVFVRDLQTDKTARAGVSAAGHQADGAGVTNVAVSSNGRHVAFVTDAANLVQGDTNASTDVFVGPRPKT